MAAFFCGVLWWLAPAPAPEALWLTVKHAPGGHGSCAVVLHLPVQPGRDFHVEKAFAWCLARLSGQVGRPTDGRFPITWTLRLLDPDSGECFAEESRHRDLAPGDTEGEGGYRFSPWSYPIATTLMLLSRTEALPSWALVLDYPRAGVEPMRGWKSPEQPEVWFATAGSGDGLRAEAAPSLLGPQGQVAPDTLWLTVCYHYFGLVFHLPVRLGQAFAGPPVGEVDRPSSTWLTGWLSEAPAGRYTLTLRVLETKDPMVKLFSRDHTGDRPRYAYYPSDLLFHGFCDLEQPVEAPCFLLLTSADEMTVFLSRSANLPHFTPPTESPQLRWGNARFGGELPQATWPKGPALVTADE